MIAEQSFIFCTEEHKKAINKLHYEMDTYDAKLGDIIKFTETFEDGGIYHFITGSSDFVNNLVELNTQEKNLACNVTNEKNGVVVRGIMVSDIFWSV